MAKAFKNMENIEEIEPTDNWFQSLTQTVKGREKASLLMWRCLLLCRSMTEV